MIGKEENTEEKIFRAANKVFLEKGMAAARMQEIADEAGINKALLHYYFRTKEKLFYTVFKRALRKFLPEVQDIMLSDLSIQEKMYLFVEDYMEALLENQFLPLFILQEINRDPDKLVNTFRESGVDPLPIIEMFRNEMIKGNIIQMDPLQFVVSVLSLIIFPIAARPMLQTVFFEKNKKAYDVFLDERKRFVADFINNAILTSRNN